MIQNRISERIQKELLFSLESARTRLSVAIAMETKSTPRDRWRYYLETTDQIRLFIKKLRNGGFESVPDCQRLSQALDVLHNLPSQSRAPRLCQILRDIVTQFE